MMRKIELSILILLLAITGAPCLPDQPVLQRLPVSEAAKARVPAKAYNPSLHTMQPVINSPLPDVVENPPPPPPPPSSPPPPPPSPPAASTSCPIDASQLGPCVGMVIGGGPFGELVIGTCCPLLGGLNPLEAQFCLCTSLMGMTFQMELVRGVLQACGRFALPGPVCLI
ncbi:36.4 kDa proline-rich protein-like [Nymphaea colorata]|uniref:36.4 kDa proline-rich protein-like n=1 Tax=Nymphaea colorata TaxID=210225 RepID=UPI00129EF816|nr:36.4 kDa proline-rich protein-like [Nymphaea colorata]